LNATNRVFHQVSQSQLVDIHYPVLQNYVPDTQVMSSKLGNVMKIIFPEVLEAIFELKTRK
jgi:hypothetical protein